MSEPLYRMRTNGVRRWMSIGATGGLGLLLVWLAAATPMPAGWRAFVFAAGAVALWGAWSIWRATSCELVLTREGLFDDAGRVLARMDDIVRLDRGIFAAKPTTGFVIRLAERAPFGWAPGVWWRVGTRLGVGGSVPGIEVKALAEMMELMIADRAGMLPRD